MNRIALLLAVVAALIGCGQFPAPARADDKDDFVAAYNQAVKLRKEAKYAEAAALYEKALRLAPSVYGENHANTANVLNNLAILY